MSKLSECFKSVSRFYVEGFRSMTIGRTLWLIVLIKLFIMFVILRIFFFKPAMSGLSQQEKQERVAVEVVTDQP